MESEDIKNHQNNWHQSLFGETASDTFLVEHYLTNLYEQAGFRRPKFVWFDSPSLFVEGIHLLGLVEDLKTIRHYLVNDYITHFIEEIKREHTTDDIKKIKSEVSGELRKTATNYFQILRDFVKKDFVKNFEGPWIAEVDYFFKNSKKLNLQGIIPFVHTFKNINLWHPCEKVCFLLKKQTRCVVSNHVFHHESGEVLRFEDGVKIYALNNALVPEWVIRSFQILSRGCQSGGLDLPLINGSQIDFENQIHQAFNGKPQYQNFE